MQSDIDFEDTGRLVVVIERKAAIDSVLIDGEVISRCDIRIQQPRLNRSSVAPVDCHGVRIQDARICKAARQRHRLVGWYHLPWNVCAVTQ